MHFAEPKLEELFGVGEQREDVEGDEGFVLFPVALPQLPESNNCSYCLVAWNVLREERQSWIAKEFCVDVNSGQRSPNPKPQGKKVGRSSEKLPALERVRRVGGRDAFDCTQKNCSNYWHDLLVPATHFSELILYYFKFGTAFYLERKPN